MASLRRLLIAVFVLASVAGFSSRGAFAMGCPAGGPNRLVGTHFIVDYNGDATSSEYITETQAGDLLSTAEQAYRAFAAMGYPAPAVNASTGKTGFSVVDLTITGFSSIVCKGDIDFDSADVGKEDTAFNVGWDVFAEVEATLLPAGTPDVWLTSGAAAWASWKALGYPAMSATDLGPFEMALDCYDPNGFQACSKTEYENQGQSRWPFYEYLDERFGATFMLEVFADLKATPGSGALGALETALGAHGTTMSAEYNAFATKLMLGGWSASSLNVAAPPLSGVINGGAATGDTPEQAFGVNHLATRFVEIDRGDGDAGHSCNAATLTITVKIPSGVASQPVFYWNGGGSSPVSLVRNGNTASATVPWDTCVWKSKGFLTLPNADTTTGNGTTFLLSTHLIVDTSTPVTATPPPAGASPYGKVVNVTSASVAPDIDVFGPQILHLSSTDTQIRIIVQSSAEGDLAAVLGSLNLGKRSLRPGANDLRYTLPKSLLDQLRTSASAGNLLTLTPTSPDGTMTGTVVTRQIAVASAKLVVKSAKKTVTKAQAAKAKAAKAKAAKAKAAKAKKAAAAKKKAKQGK